MNESGSQLLEELEEASRSASRPTAARRLGQSLRAVSAKSLHARPLRLKDRRLDRATLFPFYDGDGNTRWLLLAMEKPPRVILLEWRKGLARKPLLGTTRLDVAWSELDDATGELAEQVSAYWHFDPWWLLTQPALAAHPASHPLLITNAVEALVPVAGLYYSSDLSRVTWQATPSDAGPELQRYDPDQLPSSPLSPETRSAQTRGVHSRSTGWRLRPFWQR